MESRLPGALERVRFGPSRTLNVRAGKYTGEEAATRVEAWLRSKQVELTGEVLVITGRGAGSVGGVPVIKNATIRVLNKLRRHGVISAYAEDTAGSFVVRVAPLRSLLEAPARRRSPTSPPTRRRTPSINGLSPETRERLHYLAARALEALGVKHASEEQVNREMMRQFSVIAGAWPGGSDPDKWVDAAIRKAITDYAESDR
jgi:hypothetical protein